MASSVAGRGFAGRGSRPKSARIAVFACGAILLLCISPAFGAQVLRIAAVGDVMMGTTWPADLLPPQDGRAAFEPVAAALGGQDLLFGNLEGPLADTGEGVKCTKGSGGRCYEFRMPRRYADRLSAAGFHVMNIANNHAFDMGPEGVESTAAALEAKGIQPTGGEKVARFTVHGKRVAVVGFSASPPSRYSHSILDLDRACQVVRQVAAENDVVVVSFHGGAEGKGALHVADVEEVFVGERRGNVIRFAHAVIDAGAHLVLGHGPHVPRALEVYRGKLIAYSLGNFFVYGRFNTKGPSGWGYVLRAELDLEQGNFVGGSIASVALSDDGLPSPDPEGNAFALLRSLTDEDRAGGGLVFLPSGKVIPGKAVSAGPVSGGPAAEPR